MTWFSLLLALASAFLFNDTAQANPDTAGEKPKNVITASGKSETQNTDRVRLPDLLPTVYYKAEEARFSCRGWWGRPGRRKYYNGDERTDVLDAAGRVIATVCTRFYRELLMEGSGFLKDRGNGVITVNYDLKAGPGDHRFRVIENRCRRGEGAEPGICLIPFHTLAGDLSVWNIGDIVFIERAKGIRLPDGSLHNGLFVVRDTGGAFENIGRRRIDMFADVHKRVFLDKGFHHKRGEKAYLLTGQAKANAEAWFASKHAQYW